MKESMPSELDINKMAVEFVNQNIDSFFKVGKTALKGATDQIRLRLSSSYTNYLTTITERYSKAKSFFIQNEPTPLYDFYVPIGVTSGDTVVEQAFCSELTNINPFVVITGSGGSGKSMLMRHFLLNTVKDSVKVPVFVELRELSRAEQPVVDFIKETLHSNDFDLDDEYIIKAMSAGHFAFLLDGFDELTIESRKSVSRQILQLSKKYDKNQIIVSSRPDDEFSRWSSFTIFETNPLTLEQAKELVQKLPYDYELKQKFLKDLENSLYEDHVSFLSNPLLLSIMLLTYGQSADIPSKLNIFYNQAYEALFQRHDALKSAYQRDRLCGLDIQDFAKVLSAFCVQTYDRRRFRFTKTEALDILETSKRISEIKFDSEAFLKDALQAVCLLVEDGLSITFSHRSFQEYFVARFILEAKPNVQKSLIEKYSQTMFLDSVMHLLYEMNPYVIEQLYVIPHLTSLQEKLGVKKHVGITHFFRFLKICHSQFDINDNHIVSYTVDNTVLHNILSFTLQHYKISDNVPQNTRVPQNREVWGKYTSKDGKAVMRMRNMSYKHPFVKDIANESNNFTPSIKALQHVLNVKDQLIQKHKTLDRSLEEILSI